MGLFICLEISPVLIKLISSVGPYDYLLEQTENEYRLYSKEKIEHKKFNTSPIKIGNNCWLGSNVIVLKGVEIGNNCVIGAGCIIYKNIPAGSVVINNQELMIKNQKE